MSAVIDAAVAAIRPAAPSVLAASREHHVAYRECVCLLASDSPVPPDRHAEFAQAVELLGVDADALRADVRAIKEAARCQSLVSDLPALNDAVKAAHAEQAEFEAEVIRQRSQLIDKKNRLLMRIQVAENAARTVANLERDNPRLKA
jgi:hypothetical protein